MLQTLVLSTPSYDLLEYEVLRYAHRNVFCSACKDQKIAPICLMAVRSMTHCEAIQGAAKVFVCNRGAERSNCRLCLKERKRKTKDATLVQRVRQRHCSGGTTVSAILFCSLLSPLFVCVLVCLSLFGCCETSERGYLSPLWLWDVMI